jgi:hypothetical protein
MAHEGMTVLLLALRGGKLKPDDKQEIPGQLIWGTLTKIGTPNPKFCKRRPPFDLPSIADRGTANLYVLPKRTNSWKVYSVATSDPDDFGDTKNLRPFRSVVYLAGTLRD